MASAASTSIYVGDLDQEVNETHLFEFFNAVGPVVSVKVSRDSTTRQSRGYAFVNFSSSTDAERALDTMNFALIKGRPCRIMWANRDKTVRDNGVGNIVIKNLDESIDHKTLYDTFSMFGDILSCKVGTDKTGKSLGYGFVHYTSPSSAATAIEKINGMVIAEKKVTVEPYVSANKRFESNQADFTNVYIKFPVPCEMTDDEIKAKLQSFGAFSTCLIPRTEAGKLKGYAYFNFENHSDAEQCVASLTGEDGNLTASRAISKQERKMQAQARKKAPRNPNVNLYVKNLAPTVDDDALKELFASYGNITSARVMKSASGESKQFGFVNFDTQEAASKAMSEMNGKSIQGKEIYVGLAQTKAERSAHLRNKYAMMRRQPMPGYRPPFPGFPSAYPVPMRMPYGMPPMPAYGGPRMGTPSGPLQSSNLIGKSTADMKQMIGEKLYAQIQTVEPQKAGKITGMLLEMDHTELLHLLDNREAMLSKVNDALLVLQHSQSQ